MGRKDVVLFLCCGEKKKEEEKTAFWTKSAVSHSQLVRLGAQRLVLWMPAKHRAWGPIVIMLELICFSKWAIMS